MADGEDQTDELALIGHKFGVVWRDLLAEEGEGATTLMTNSTEAQPGRVAFDNEVVAEVRQLKQWRRGERWLRCRGECWLQHVEGRLHLLHPPEASLAKPGSQWYCDRVVVIDEAPVIPGEAEEGADDLHRLRHRPLHHRAHLLVDHGHPSRGDDVAKVGHLATERALGLLHE
jgi:hypothetical protein